MKAASFALPTPEMDGPPTGMSCRRPKITMAGDGCARLGTLDNEIAEGTERKVLLGGPSPNHFQSTTYDLIPVLHPPAPLTPSPFLMR